MLKVLTSFLGSILAMYTVILWAFFKGYLPQFLLNDADRYALTLLRQPQQTFGNKPHNPQVMAFIKALGDQQLVTGLVIIVAGLATRCSISCYEFSIVTNLAYFSTLVHVLYLDVAREELQKSTFSLICRVGMSLCFMILFSFAFILNSIRVSSSSVSSGNALQCVFQMREAEMGVATTLIALDMIVLMINVLSYLVAFCNLFLDLSTDITSQLLFWISIALLRYTGLEYVERREVLHTSIRRYTAWLEPVERKDGKTRISPWYILERYFSSYQHELGFICIQLAYGTSAVRSAIWADGKISTAKLKSMSFGQIVALALFLLVLLSVSDISTSKYIWYDAISADSMC
jgi:hypothetical protein